VVEPSRIGVVVQLQVQGLANNTFCMEGHIENFISTGGHLYYKIVTSDQVKMRFQMKHVE